MAAGGVDGILRVDSRRDPVSRLDSHGFRFLGIESEGFRGMGEAREKGHERVRYAGDGSVRADVDLELRIEHRNAPEGLTEVHVGGAAHRGRDDVANAHLGQVECLEAEKRKVVLEKRHRDLNRRQTGARLGEAPHRVHERAGDAGGRVERREERSPELTVEIGDRATLIVAG